jgi:hypothetical protein
MKGPRRLHRTGPGTGAAAAVKGPRCGGGGGERYSRFLDGGPTVATCEGNENWEVVQTESRVLNLHSKVSAAVLHRTAVEYCISTAVHRQNHC